MVSLEFKDRFLKSERFSLICYKNCHNYNQFQQSNLIGGGYQKKKKKLIGGANGIITQLVDKWAWGLDK